MFKKCDIAGPFLRKPNIIQLVNCGTLICCFSECCELRTCMLVNFVELVHMGLQKLIIHLIVVLFNILLSYYHNHWFINFYNNFSHLN